MKCINSKEDLFDASKIGYLYLYLSQGNSITVDNGIVKLELTMSESGSVMAKNLTYPECGLLFYDEHLIFESLLVIISQLKNQPGIYGNNKWQDICLEVGSTLSLNQHNERN